MARIGGVHKGFVKDCVKVSFFQPEGHGCCEDFLHSISARRSEYWYFETSYILFVYSFTIDHWCFFFQISILSRTDLDEFSLLRRVSTNIILLKICSQFPLFLFLSFCSQSYSHIGSIHSPDGLQSSIHSLSFSPILFFVLASSNIPHLHPTSGGKKSKCGGTTVPRLGMVIAGLLPSGSKTRGTSGGRAEESTESPTTGMQAEGISRLMICRTRFVSKHAHARATRGSKGAGKNYLHAEICLEKEWRVPTTMLSSR